MPPTTTLAGLVLSGIVLIVALLLVVRQRGEQRRRDDAELSPEAAEHYARQDRRRVWGIALLVLIALGIVVGTWVNPMAGRGPRLVFAGTWLMVIVLIGVLLVLAVRDGMATQVFAKKQLRAISEERHAMLVEAERRRRAMIGNGQGDARHPLDFDEEHKNDI